MLDPRSVRRACTPPRILCCVYHTGPGPAILIFMCALARFTFCTCNFSLIRRNLQKNKLKHAWTRETNDIFVFRIKFAFAFAFSLVVMVIAQLNKVLGQFSLLVKVFSMNHVDGICSHWQEVARIFYIDLNICYLELNVLNNVLIKAIVC